MGKKDRERLHLRIDDHLARMTPTDLTRGEVIDSLRAAGCDVEQLRERLHQRARDLANAQRAKGKPAPDYLQQVIDCTGPPDAVPKDPKSALTKAKQWIAALTQPPSGIGEIQVARAYRKDGELSQRDKQLLDDTGAALVAITENSSSRRYGIELDAHRALEARTTLDEVIQGNAFDAKAPVESFSLLYLNPPYDFEVGEGKNQRMEKLFLDDFFRWLKPGGVLAMVIPFDRIHECRNILSPHFKDKAIYRLRAMSENARPKPTTKLRVAPYFNVSGEDGLTCQGTMRSPEDAGVATIPLWERAFFQSEFTHQTGARRLTIHPGGFLGLWASLSGSRKPFPVEHLAPANQTLLEFVTRDSR